MGRSVNKSGADSGCGCGGGGCDVVQGGVSSKDQSRAAELALANTKEQLANTGEQLSSLEQQLANTEQQLANTEPQLANTEQQLANTEQQLVKTKQELQGALGDVEAARAAAEAARVEAVAAEADGKAKLEAVAAELNAALEVVRAELAIAKRDAQRSSATAATSDAAAADAAAGRATLARTAALERVFAHWERELALRSSACFSRWRWSAAALGAVAWERALRRRSGMAHLARVCYSAESTVLRLALRRWHATIIVATLLSLQRDADAARANADAADRSAAPRRMFLIWAARRADRVRWALRVWMHAVVASEDGGATMELAALEAAVLGGIYH
jgi:hypothetical protein